ncbi:hypothetical protein HDV02_006145 [Globomyces sp. JEL0801]|nr:hypothetical protein HDV02_006145 [Globomyces sp. JEL0801]
MNLKVIHLQIRRLVLSNNSNLQTRRLPWLTTTRIVSQKLEEAYLTVGTDLNAIQQQFLPGFQKSTIEVRLNSYLNKRRKWKIEEEIYITNTIKRDGTLSMKEILSISNTLGRSKAAVIGRGYNVILHRIRCEMAAIKYNTGQDVSVSTICDTLLEEYEVMQKSSPDGWFPEERTITLPYQHPYMQLLEEGIRKYGLNAEAIRKEYFPNMCLWMVWKDLSQYYPCHTTKGNKLPEKIALLNHVKEHGPRNWKKLRESYGLRAPWCTITWNKFRTEMDINSYDSVQVVQNKIDEQIAKLSRDNLKEGQKKWDNKHQGVLEAGIRIFGPDLKKIHEVFFPNHTFEVFEKHYHLGLTSKKKFRFNLSEYIEILKFGLEKEETGKSWRRLDELLNRVPNSCYTKWKYTLKLLGFTRLDPDNDKARTAMLKYLEMLIEKQRKQQELLDT